MYVNVIIIISAEKPRGHWSDVYFYDSFYVIAMFTKIILGFFQVESMMELVIRINYN
jgi:hypothetical protein